MISDHRCFLEQILASDKEVKVDMFFFFTFNRLNRVEILILLNSSDFFLAMVALPIKGFVMGKIYY